MESLLTACRLSARLTARHLRQDAYSRSFRTSATALVAQNFTMPALSPTMTEGNIAKWNLKEGDSFSAGDVLLEIETDKASMDVEAQDDGILAKIIQIDGSKGIQVGTRIGVLAETGDDLTSLEIPEENGAAPPKQESKPEPPTKSDAEAPERSSSKSTTAPSRKSDASVKPQAYPLLPSVGHLIHEHGLDQSAIDKMIPTGPNNRLLKGDVLAYLGSISTSYPAELSGRISKLGHLDLSNIKLAAPTPTPAKPVSEPAVEADSEITVPISFKAVLELQERIHKTLGILLPVSSFVHRATKAANIDLPLSRSTTASPDELFNEVLGLDKVITSAGTRGSFMPQMSAIPSSWVQHPLKPAAKKVDIIDILAGTPQVSSVSKSTPDWLTDDMKLFTLEVPKAEEERAFSFLSRMKTVLEEDPGRLIL